MAYWKHTRSITREIPYEFTCEQCMQHSGQMTAVIKADFEKRSTKKILSDMESAELKKDVQDIMEARLRGIRKDAEKDDFADEFKDTCPHCGKPQTWGIKGISYIPWLYGFVSGLICVFITTFAASWMGWSFLQGAGVVLAFAVAGFVAGKIRIQIKKGKTKGAEPRRPVIHWPDDITLANDRK